MQVRLHLRDALGQVLRNQHLVPQAQHDDVVRVVGDLVGLHATLPMTPYLSLFARMPGFHRAWLERELYVARTLVRMKCMRKTLFIVSGPMLAPLFAATTRANVASTRRSLASAGWN